MVVTRRKKILKKRGHRTAGYGGSKKHRGGGSRGGRGLAGLHKHKRMTAIKYMPDHFGKSGFKRPRKVIKEIKIINLKDLDLKIENLLKEKKIEKTKDGIKINLKKLGYDKLLGKGKINNKIILEANQVSRIAKSKIEKNKGKVIVS